MNRRSFVAASASAVVATTSNAAAAILGQQLPRAGKRVTVSGWLTPSAQGPGHYFVFAPRAENSAPGSEFAQGSNDVTLVYPAAGSALRPGRATLQGRLQQGRFKDGVTGHPARFVLTEARTV